MTDRRDSYDPFPPWGLHHVEGTGPTEIAVGPLRLLFAEEAGEVRMARHREDDDPGELEWTRWAVRDWDGRVRLVPAFQDRPLVVEPEDTFWLTNGAEARIYVRVSLQVRVEAVGRTSIELATAPTTEISDTWWGSLEDGELCYWFPTRARRAVTPDLFEPHRVICPIHLVNEADEDLLVERIALRVAYLSLFARNGRELWSDATTVRYRGDAEGSRLEMAGRPPEEAPDARLVVPPREQMARGFRARTFARLRNIQGWI